MDRFSRLAWTNFLSSRQKSCRFVASVNGPLETRAEAYTSNLGMLFTEVAMEGAAMYRCMSALLGCVCVELKQTKKKGTKGRGR